MSEKQKPDPAKCLYCTREEPEDCDNQPRGPGSCPQLARTAAKTAPARGEKDKSMIWDDCPECARKHLAAAYAALAGPADGGFAPDWEVLLARAVIAEGERRAGYAGNIDLAIGCLAMAELQPDVDPAVAAEIRGERLRQSASRDAGPLRLGRFPGRSAFAAAHLLEACREAPAVADRICLGRWFGDGGFFRCGVSAQEGAESAEDLDCVLRGLLKWIKETYEIGGAE